MLRRFQFLLRASPLGQDPPCPALGQMLGHCEQFRQFGHRARGDIVEMVRDALGLHLGHLGVEPKFGHCAAEEVGAKLARLDQCHWRAGDDGDDDPGQPRARTDITPVPRFPSSASCSAVVEMARIEFGDRRRRDEILTLILVDHERFEVRQAGPVFHVKHRSCRGPHQREMERGQRRRRNPRRCATLHRSSTGARGDSRSIISVDKPGNARHNRNRADRDQPVAVAGGKFLRPGVRDKARRRPRRSPPASPDRRHARRGSAARPRPGAAIRAAADAGMSATPSARRRRSVKRRARAAPTVFEPLVDKRSPALGRATRPASAIGPSRDTALSARR